MTTQRITAGVYLVDAPCPRCGALEEILVGIGTTLTTPLNGIPQLKVTKASKSRDHDCAQRRVPDDALGIERETTS